MRSPFVRILLITLLLQTVIYAMRPMVSYKAISIGANNAELGLIASSFAVLSLLVAVSIGRWVDRWGEPRFVIAGAVIILSVAVGLIWIDSIWALAASQAILGLGHILSVVATQALVANRGDPKKRNGRFGMFTVIVSLGQLVGPAGGGLLAGTSASDPSENTLGFGVEQVFLGATIASLLATIIALSLIQPARGTRGREKRVAPATDASPQLHLKYWESVGRVMKTPNMPQAMLVSLSVLTAIDILAAYLPAYGQANGLSVETVGLLLAARAAASMGSRLLMLPLLKFAGLRWTLALSAVLPALALAVFPFVGSLPVLYVLLALAGFGLGLGQPVTLAWVAGQAPRAIRGTALGVRITGNRLGQTVLPAAIGLIAGASSISAIFLALAGLLGASTLAVLRADFSKDLSSDQD
ncbi:Major Facilitator Superfamily protein [Cryobacterium flavum]|nr:MFS transporter [Cryobacterium flavum]SDN96455.1 Major Facilitator Superfamily protein [Cryobacterium flavum]